jgi:hypothetical protein
MAEQGSNLRHKFIIILRIWVLWQRTTAALALWRLTVQDRTFITTTDPEPVK